MAVIAMVFAFVPALMTLVFPTFVATGGVLAPRRVFTVLSLVSELRVQAGSLVARAVFTMLEGLVAVSRVKVGHVTSGNFLIIVM